MISYINEVNKYNVRNTDTGETTIFKIYEEEQTYILNQGEYANQ